MLTEHARAAGRPASKHRPRYNAAQPLCVCAVARARAYRRSATPARYGARRAARLRELRLSQELHMQLAEARGRRSQQRPLDPAKAG